MGWGSQLPSVSRLCLLALAVDGLAQPLARASTTASSHGRTHDDDALQGNAALGDQGTDGERFRG
eukprot:9495343-Pyramimonas_sp.AAC.1